MGERFENNKHKGWLLAGGIVIGVIILFAFVNQSFLETKETTVIIQETAVEKEITGGTRIPTASERLEERYSMDREKYTVYLDAHGYNTFDSLPEIPEDFGSKNYLISTGKITDFSEITREYYLQPEFYPLFEKNGLPFYQAYDGRYIGTFGWGIYPSEQWINAKAGTEGTIEFFFKTGWGVETYQGVNYVMKSNCNWIETEAIEPVFLTPPSYQEFCTIESCGHDWARKKTVKITISEQAKIGAKCNVTLHPIKPPQEKIDEWFKEYGTDYVTASGSMVTAGMPLVIYVKVV